MCEHSDCEHSLGSGSHCDTCDRLSRENPMKSFDEWIDTAVKAAWAQSGNYTCDEEVMPSEVIFANGRVVRIIERTDGVEGYYLDISGLDEGNHSSLLRRLKMQPEASGWAYRYADCIRFNHGQEVNGGRAIEAIPYYFGKPQLIVRAI